MRITLNLDDDLLAAAKVSAQSERVSLSNYVERKLRDYLNVAGAEAKTGNPSES